MNITGDCLLLFRAYPLHNGSPVPGPALPVTPFAPQRKGDPICAEDRSIVVGRAGPGTYESHETDDRQKQDEVRDSQTHLTRPYKNLSCRGCLIYVMSRRLCDEAISQSQASGRAYLL